MNEQTQADTGGGLDGIPGLGPARRAALAAAGITSRADLVAATTDQLVSVTGMPRSQAERALAALKTTRAAPEEALTAPAAALPEIPPDEALPDENGAAPLPDESEPTAPEPEPSTDLDRAIFKARTALSDATRLLAEASGLHKSLEKLGVLLEGLSRRTEKLGAKRRTRLAERLDALTRRLERAAARSHEMTPERAKRLRERLKTERQAIAEAIALKPRRSGGRGK
jgi:hypothetical protein